MKRWPLGRRALLKLGVTASAGSLLSCGPGEVFEDNWWQGDIQHILPLVSHQSVNIKLSFASPRNTVPLLRIGELTVEGQQQDSDGRFWAFRSSGLQANEEYTLQLFDQAGAALCDSWALTTFPEGDHPTEKLTIAAFTCAGGPDIGVLPGGWHGFKPATYRRKLYDLILDKKPDLVVANGDHIYWDYHSWVDNMDNGLAREAMYYFLGRYGHFNDEEPVLGTANESILTAIADEQIAGTYGVRFRSTPIIFVTDDHDYFDNDDATPEKVTFPPNEFHQQLRNNLQKFYFPEFIVEEEVDAQLPGAINDTSPRLSTHFGAVRYGNLFSGVFYDCGGMLTLEEEAAGLIPAQAEHWLHEKTALEDSQYFAHFPSHPMGWTAGKWREWYPDVLHSDGALLVEIERDEAGNKYLWQNGWWLQHQRILASLASQRHRKPLLVSGDLHLLGAGKIHRSGELDFSARPITSILSGPVGVGDLGWLSSARGVTVDTPQALTVEQSFPPQERNGFTLLTFDTGGCQIELFACPEGYVKPKELSLESRGVFNL